MESSRDFMNVLNGILSDFMVESGGFSVKHGDWMGFWWVLAMGHLRKNIFERGVSQQQVYPEVFRSCVNQPKWRVIIWKHLNQPKLKLCFVILKHFNQKYFQPRKNGGSAWNCPARTGLELFGCHGDLIHSKIGNKWRNRYNNTCNGTMIYIYTYYLNT